MLADGWLKMHFFNKKPCAKSQNMTSKPEPDVVLAVILDLGGAK